MRLALGLLLSSAAFAHGGEARVVDLLFADGEVWPLVDARGIYALGGETRWLCDDALDTEPGLQGMAFVEDAMLVSGSGGLVRSEDGGCSFTAVGGALEGHELGGLHPHPERPEVLTASQSLNRENGAFLSEDAGRTWRAVGPRGDRRVRGLLRSPADPEVVYLNADWGLARSEDGGRSFTAISPGEGVAPDELRMLAADPVDRLTAWAVIERYPVATLVRTEDGGESWQTSLELGDAPESLAIKGGHMLLATPFEGLYRSADGGQSWAPVTTPPGLILGCLRDEPGSDRVWACGRGGEWVLGYTEDLGETWSTALPDFVAEASPWSCAAEAPSMTLCEQACAPGDPDCAQVTAPEPTPDPPEEESPPEEEEPETEEAAKAEGCTATPGAPLPWLALLLLVGMRRRTLR